MISISSVNFVDMSNRLIFVFDVYVCLRLYCLFSSFDLFCVCEPTHGSLGGSCDSHSSICAARSFGAGPTASLTPPPSAPPFKAVPPSAVVESIKNYRQRWARQSYTSTKWITTRIKADKSPSRSACPNEIHAGRQWIRTDTWALIWSNDGNQFDVAVCVAVCSIR